MNREELLTLCDQYVRRRGLGAGVIAVPPALEILDSFLHAEISESEKNSLLAYVRLGDEDSEDIEDVEGLGVASLEASEDDGD